MVHNAESATYHRELRANLSKQGTSRSSGGKTITITDHGRPIARIVPVGTPIDVDEPLVRRAAELARRSGDVQMLAAWAEMGIATVYDNNRDD